VDPRSAVARTTVVSGRARLTQRRFVGDDALPGNAAPGALLAGHPFCAGHFAFTQRRQGTRVDARVYTGVHPRLRVARAGVDRLANPGAEAAHARSPARPRRAESSPLAADGRRARAPAVAAGGLVGLAPRAARGGGGHRRRRSGGGRDRTLAGTAPFACA